MLSTYLIEMGEGEFSYVVGERPTVAGDGMQSHAWRQQGDLVVDITADQFAGVSESVIVSAEPTPFHLSFESRPARILAQTHIDSFSVQERTVAWERRKRGRTPPARRSAA